MLAKERIELELRDARPYPTDTILLIQLDLLQLLRAEDNSSLIWYASPF